MCKSVAYILPFVLCLSVATGLLRPSPLAADEVYKWVDASGRVHFGSRLPKNARERKNATPVEKTTVSRYSTKKMISGFGDMIKKSDANASATQSTDNQTSSHLKAGKPNLEYKGPVLLKCEVSVKNTGTRREKGIRVSFEFEDGKVTNAVGPTSLMPGISATYFIPPDKLPLLLSLQDLLLKSEHPKPPVVHITQG